MLNLLRNSGVPRHWLCPHHFAERARTGSSRALGRASCLSRERVLTEEL